MFKKSLFGGKEPHLVEQKEVILFCMQSFSLGLETRRQCIKLSFEDLQGNWQHKIVTPVRGKG